jgi:hypothetical protein
MVSRAIDISNSFEMKFERAADGSIAINPAFLIKKQEQCEGQDLRGDGVAAVHFHHCPARNSCPPSIIVLHCLKFKIQL